MMKKLLVLFVFLLLAGAVRAADPADTGRWHDSLMQRDWISVATLAYSSSESLAVVYASQYADIIAATTDAGSVRHNPAIARAADATTRLLDYMTFSTYIWDEPTNANDSLEYDSAKVDTFINLWTGGSFVWDSMFILTDTVGTQDDTLYAISALDANTPGCDSLRYAVADTIASVCHHTHHRLAPNFTYAGVWAFFRYKVASSALDWGLVYASQQDTFTYDGVFEDEQTQANGPFVELAGHNFPWHLNNYSLDNDTGAGLNFQFRGMLHPAIRDSLDSLEVNGWLQPLIDTCHDLNIRRFPNPAGYGFVPYLPVTEVFTHGADLWAGEYMYVNPLQSFGGDEDGKMWRIMDTVMNYDSDSVGRIVCWMDNRSTDTLALGGSRSFMDRLIFYYMAADPAYHTFAITSTTGSAQGANGWGMADTALRYKPALDYNIGLPDSARYVDTSGTDGAAQSFDVYRRDFTSSGLGREVVMLFRKKDGTDYSNTSAVTVQLGGTYQEVLADSTLGSAITEADIRNVEGRIFVQAAASGGGSSVSGSVNISGNVRIE